MKYSSFASKPDCLVCPICESGRLRSPDNGSARCDSCAFLVNGAILKAIRQITTLRESFGSHACECGHPEMRLLPDGTFHCPACGSEVLPIDAPSVFSEPGEHGLAYRAGWLDGCFGKLGTFVDNPNLARWEDPYDRLDFYRGHRAGSEVRQASNRRNPKAREKLVG